MPSIGEKIKELRSAKKMTQEALAQNLNVTVSAVSQWESGKTMPDISMLVPLCHMFSVSADDLLGIRIGEQDAVLNETKSEVEKLVANGDYNAAFTELRKKIADFPDNGPCVLNCMISQSKNILWINGKAVLWKKKRLLTKSCFSR